MRYGLSVHFVHILLENVVVSLPFYFPKRPYRAEGNANSQSSWRIVYQDYEASSQITRNPE